MDESDLVEDIAIAYGFERLAPRKPAFPTTGSKSAEEQFAGRARDAMVGFGFQEVMTFMLTSEGRHYFGEKPGERVEISNPLTQETTMVRTRLLPSVLETLRNNKHHRYPQMLFEAGEVVERDPKTETGGRSVRRLCAVIADASATFTSAQSVLEGLGRELGLTIGIKEKDFPFMIPGRSAAFERGFVGEVHPAVLNALGIEVPVSCFELELKFRGERE
jgi:phenylalanyl-tRNA synthetase beta chain